MEDRMKEILLDMGVENENKTDFFFGRGNKKDEK